MAYKFKLVTVDYQDYDSDLIGVSKDSWVNKDMRTSNYGHSSLLAVNEYDTNPYSREMAIIEVTMPYSRDLPEADEIQQILLRLRVQTAESATPTGVGIFPLSEDDSLWQEGTQTGGAGYCNWDKRDNALIWANSTDHDSLAADDAVAIESVQAGPTVGAWVEFDLTKVLGFGQKKSFYLRNLVDLQNKGVSFSSRESATPSYRPVLRIIYRDYPPEAFIDEDSFLTIKPNPDNPEQPKLDWGKVSDAGFTAYKVYRKTTPFTVPSSATLIATITDPSTNFYIDTSALSENQNYYYMVTAEDNENTGDDATYSGVVTFIRPDCTHSEATENVDVGELVSITLNSTIPCKRAYVEWGDAVDGYWIESDIEKTSFTIYHRYSETGAKVIKGRLESSDGYWSDLDTVCTKTVDDTTPEAILIVRPLEVVSGESVRCIGAKSQPVASDALISQYDYYVNGSWHIDEGPVFDVVPTSSQEIRLRIFTDTGETYTQGVGEGEDVTVISGDPTLLEFGPDTTVSMREESRASDSEELSIMDGVGEIDLPYAIRNRVYTINGLSARQDFKDDIDKIRDRQETQEYTRIEIIDEKDGITVRLDGRITGYRITQTTRNYVTWSFGFRVFERSEV